MTTPSPIKITAETQPLFPCWLWQPDGEHWVKWHLTGHRGAEWRELGHTHWSASKPTCSPDQPSAPTVTPDAPMSTQVPPTPRGALVLRVDQITLASPAATSSKNPMDVQFQVGAKTVAESVEGKWHYWPMSPQGVDEKPGICLKCGHGISTCTCLLPKFPAPPAATTPEWAKQLERDIRSIKDAANESIASSPPAGYDELDGDSLRIADECHQSALNAMETAVLNWLHGYAPAPDGEGSLLFSQRQLPIVMAELATLRAENERLTNLKESAERYASEFRAERDTLREALRKIRNSAGEQVMVCTAEGHSECVHRANAALSTRPTDGPGDSAMLDWLSEHPFFRVGWMSNLLRNAEPGKASLRSAIRAAMPSQEGAK